MSIPVLIDCDPGHDDAIALMLAFGSGKLDVLGVTTVAGNGTGENTFKNALGVLSLIGADVEVARGADRPILRPIMTAGIVHGAGGLEGPSMPEPTLRASRRTAVELLSSTLREFPGKVTLVPTGPLTNIAIVFLAFPEVKRKVERIVLMGGAAKESNWTPAAEFNVVVDPEAARIVFESGVPITMIGLDATHKALIYPDEVDELRRMGPIGSFAGELMDHYSKFYRAQGFEGNPIHDALAVAAVFDPEIVKTVHSHVDIETRGEFTLGRTVVDLGRVTGKTPNAEVAMEVDRRRFIGQVLSSVRALEDPADQK